MSSSADRELNVLLVEDDTVDILNVRRAFERHDIQSRLWVAGNGVEGLEMLRGDEIPKARRLVLLDLYMPMMDGIEFLRELRADVALRATPVVVLTISDQEKDRVEAYNLLVAGYIRKPITPTSFAEAMGTLRRYWSYAEMP